MVKVKTVVFQARVLTHYRVSFHSAVKRTLAESGVNYRLITGQPRSKELLKGDSGVLEWAEVTENKYFLGDRFVWLGKPNLSDVDMLIIGQENANLSNYPIQIMRHFRPYSVAYFGHGKNFQAKSSNNLSEKLKRFWATKVDWWFAYTERSSDVVISSGFPSQKITVFNNSIDTNTIRSELKNIDTERLALLRANLCLSSERVGVYIGGLYDLKRIDFLIEAAKEVRLRVPDFQLLVIGGGADRAIVEEAGRTHAWIHSLGPKFGLEKTTLASLGQVFLMPGLVGLGVLDSFAYGIPMVTTNLPYHSPEFDYLKDGENGVVVSESESVKAYADAVVRVLTDETWRSHLQAGAAEALQTYTIEAMAQRFAEGVVKALDE